MPPEGLEAQAIPVEPEAAAIPVEPEVEPVAAAIAVEPEVEPVSLAIVVEPAAVRDFAAIVPATTAPPLIIEPADLAVAAHAPPVVAPASPTLPEIYRVVVACCSSPGNAPVDQPEKEGRPGI